MDHLVNPSREMTQRFGAWVGTAVFGPASPSMAANSTRHMYTTFDEADAERLQKSFWICDILEMWKEIC